MRRLSAINRYLEHLALKKADQKLKSLHNELISILDESHENWPHYDYGEGYYYQSYPTVFEIQTFVSNFIIWKHY